MMAGRAEKGRARRRRGLGTAIRMTAVMIVVLFGAANYLVLDHAIELSHDRLCTVSRTVQLPTPVDHVRG